MIHASKEFQRDIVINIYKGRAIIIQIIQLKLILT
jgi:hypothetical protein